VAGQRGLHRRAERLGVADLPHHDDVRILSKNGAEALGEGEPCFVVGLPLVRAGERVLDRVFDVFAVVPIERFTNLVLERDDRFDATAGRESNVIERREVFSGPRSPLAAWTRSSGVGTRGVCGRPSESDKSSVITEEQSPLQREDQTNN
jgi:hypothetical protein